MMLFSAISVRGVALVNISALVCTLSVFNGFQDLVATFFTAFDPELKITAVTGKVFDGQEARIEALRRMVEYPLFFLSPWKRMCWFSIRAVRHMVGASREFEDNFEDLTAI